ncbi:RtcB family protein [Candidatus Pacearchaeota archaeon]|nr:RtcB family protein [Candidatus Pacearchaeota archaeon]
MVEIKKISKYEWLIPKEGAMNVPVVIFASEKLLEKMKEDITLQQAMNVAQLPGIVEKSIVLPDAHQGYGMSIGGVAAFDLNSGVISPGCVGYDIDCSVRLLSTNLNNKDIKGKEEQISSQLFRDVPSGVGEKGRIRLTKEELDEVLKNGAQWAVKKGYGEKEDYVHTEEEGKMKEANPEYVSERAKIRGMPQLGSLGAGNHFLEVQEVDEIYDKEIARKFGIKEKGQVTIMIHCGSRGLGHQVASDYIKLMEDEYGFENLPDRELINAPISSELGKKYFGAMAAAVNFAFANKQLITHWVREAMKRIFPNFKAEVIYEVCHNIAKFETHNINGEEKKVLIMRKGATRSFGPGRKELPKDYIDIGQPVLIPGSMGTSSYILVGTKKAEELTFGSTCFTGDTKIITDKGIITLKEINERFQNGEKFLALSINESNLELEWKPIMNTFKRKSDVVEISISQTNRSNLSKLRTTRDHNFLTLKNFNLIGEEIEKIISKEKMLIAVDSLKSDIQKSINPNLAYLVGALVTDGYVYLDKRRGKITFTQKKVAKKLDFIYHVQNCFRECFNTELREYKTKFGGGTIRGRQIYGEGTDFICCQKNPAIEILNITSNLPKWVMELDKEANFNFLAGIIDGDGAWNPNRQVLDIFTGDENVAEAILLSCLKMGILPYISKQRGSCFVIQISEKEDLIFGYTKRVKGIFRKRKYGQKLFSAKQMFEGVEVRWPFLHKAIRNNLISYEQILKHIHKYPEIKKEVKKLIESPIRMLRVKKLKDVGISELYNIEVADNHNYVVLTDMFMPIFVKNCHGAGRVMSRHEALRHQRGEEVKSNLKKLGIEVKSGSWKGLAEEAPESYKDIEEVVKTSHELGIGRLVAKVKPLIVIKG